MSGVFIIVLVFSSIFLLVSFINLLFAQKLKQVKFKLEAKFKLSILIPARNEEENLPIILNSLINQNYKDFEIIVLNDNSSDKTEKVVLDFAKQDSRIKLINGSIPPKNTLGKNWACWQLYQVSQGDLLLFLDSDVWLNNKALSSALDYFNTNNLDFLSIFPTQKMYTPGEIVSVVTINFFLLTMLPLFFIRKLKNKNFSAANGQFLLFKKESYKIIGGHKAVINTLVEDVALCKLIKECNLKADTILGGEMVYCRMYSNFKFAFNGVSKAFYNIFNIGVFFYSLFSILILMVYSAPLVLIFIDSKFLIILSLNYLTLFFVTIKSNQNLFLNLFFSPFIFINYFLILIYSMYINIFNKVVWKERKINQ